MSEISKIQEVIDIYTDTKNKVSEVLKNEPSLLLRSDTVLNKLINSLKHSIGVSINEDTQIGNKPLKYIFGRKLKNSNTYDVPPISIQQLIPKDQELENLKISVDKIFNSIEKRENKEILNSCNEMELRALGKKVGVEYTREKVPSLNFKFIDELRNAVIEIKKRELLKKQTSDLNQLNYKISLLEKEDFIVEKKEYDLYEIIKNEQIVKVVSKEVLVQLSDEGLKSFMDPSNYSNTDGGLNTQKIDEVFKKNSELLKDENLSKYTLESSKLYQEKFKSLIAGLNIIDTQDSLNMFVEELEKSFDLLVVSTKRKTNK